MARKWKIHNAYCTCNVEESMACCWVSITTQNLPTSHFNFNFCVLIIGYSIFKLKCILWQTIILLDWVKWWRIYFSGFYLDRDQTYCRRVLNKSCTTGTTQHLSTWIWKSILYSSATGLLGNLYWIHGWGGIESFLFA